MNHLNIAVAVALSLAFAAGCKRPSNETSDTRTTSATPNEAARGATPNTTNPNTTTPNTTMDTPNTMNAPTGATPANADVDFMKKAALGGMLEVKLGQEAASRASRPEVKTFANHMVTDHGKANNELKELAAKKGVTLPMQLDDEHTKKVNDLTKLSGPQFDEKYAKAMVDDHEDTVKDFKKAASDAKDPDIRSWAGTTLPTLTSHLQMARDMESKKGAASTGPHPH